MKTIFVTGTAGSGKSSLTSKLYEYYTRNGAFAAVLNLDPGVESMPYNCDVDVRDYVDYVSIMQQYSLGPNGALVMANDLIASKIDEIQSEVNNINPDYLIVDTPGQIELFAYRQSGPFFVNEFVAEEKMSLFLFDGTMVSSPSNFVSLTLLSTSIRLRLGLPTVNVITKTDLIQEKLEKVLSWSGTDSQLEADLAGELNGDTFSLVSDMLSSLNRHDFQQDLIPVSNLTGDGMVSLQSALSRTINLGEELED